jgi:hypothetical protein
VLEIGLSRHLIEKASIRVCGTKFEGVQRPGGIGSCDLCTLYIDCTSVIFMIVWNMGKLKLSSNRIPSSLFGPTVAKISSSIYGLMKGMYKKMRQGIRHNAVINTRKSSPSN